METEIELVAKKMRKLFIFEEHANVGHWLYVVTIRTAEGNKFGGDVRLGRIISIAPDKIKKEWWLYEVFFPITPTGPEKVFWHLRSEQADGLETFTMGGIPMWMAPIVDMISKEEKQQIEEEQKPKKPGKVIQLFGGKSDGHIK